ncbi:MAG: rhodanese-like domain-containing protein [Bacteroidota bacterium]|nr:rhodanese-like domain-containing protein [Bacteroidota bacterium]
MSLKKQIVLVLSISVLLFSCGNVDDKSYADGDAMVKNAKSKIESIDVVDLKTVMDKHYENVVIVDCREPDEYIAKHIKGAINVPRGMFEFSPKIDNRRNTYYVYSNTDKRASLACYSLKYLKHKNIVLVNGGINAWLKKYPELFEEGAESGEVLPVKVEESSGCGG